MKALVMGREMELPYLDRDNQDPWFLNWVLKHPSQAGKHLACSDVAIASILDVYAVSEIWDVYEFFGGIGSQALSAERILDPECHWVRDLHPDAVKHLRRVLPEYVAVRQQDAYAVTDFEPVDVVLADFGDLTAFKAQASQKQGQLLAKIFASNPRAVVLTDIAARYLHLQKKSYEPILGEGTCDSYESYLKALTDNLRARFGYSLHAAYYTHWSCVFTMVPSDQTVVGSGRMVKLPAEIEGLKLL